MRRLRLRPRLDGRVNRKPVFTTAADDRSAFGAAARPRTRGHRGASGRASPLRFRVCVRAFFAGRDVAVFVNPIRFSVQPLDLNVRSSALFPNRGASRHMRIPARMIQISRTELAVMLIVIAKDVMACIGLHGSARNPR